SGCSQERQANCSYDEHNRHGVSQVYWQDAGGNGAKALGRVRPVGFYVACIIDQVNRRSAQAEHDEGQGHIQQGAGMEERISTGSRWGSQNQYVFHPLLDRKSTRLNSSHVSSSYGVFCWK